jgi:hypothetical protein
MLPPLFAPTIDPGLLARARAVGLSLQDVLAELDEPPPAHRFTFLIERAKSFTTTVQSIGNALLAALEKRDAEELGRLRAVHETNLLKLSRDINKWEVEAASETEQSLRKQREAAQYRRDHYQALLDEDLLTSERTQQDARHTASILTGVASRLDTLAGIIHLIPQIGSPFAMTYGGEEIGSSLRSWSGVLVDASRVYEVEAQSTGLEATFERRRQDWGLQRGLVERELEQLDRQIIAAKIRTQIAQKTLKNHEVRVEQSREVYDVLRDKFTSFGHYTWLSAELQRLHRDSFNTALYIARRAMRAYKFERGGDGPDLPTGLWDKERSGLLSGERLHLELLKLERLFYETDERQLEITQAISMAQLDPAELVKLRETGECQMTVPEAVFDLAYPGHYHRQIKSVRLTVPCVTGPYTSVNATLSLQESHIRIRPSLDPSARVPMPSSRTKTIATSTGKSDAGLFELNFRDEKYLPFEGAGVDSIWKLRLPKIRTLDYGTISDVILEFSYTARTDEMLRTEVEKAMGTLETYITGSNLRRLFSFKTDFASQLHALMHSATGSEITVRIEPKHFPFFVSGRTLAFGTAKLALNASEVPENLILRINGLPFDDFTSDENLGGLYSADISGAMAPSIVGDMTFEIEQAGTLASADGNGAIDPAKLADVLLYVEYGATS